MARRYLVPVGVTEVRVRVAREDAIRRLSVALGEDFAAVEAATNGVGVREINLETDRIQAGMPATLAIERPEQ